MPAPAESILDALDEEQRAAAEILSGPLCILAGAGTGKTRTITHRIAYGVASGAYAPNRVMALTFTSRAAAELRERLRVLGAAGVVARTFHATALSQLNFFWPHVVGGAFPEVLSSKGRTLAAAAQSLRLGVDTASLRDVAAEIEWRKISALTIPEYERALPGRGLPKSLDPGTLFAVMRRYEELKDERRQIDFEDVLLLCAGMIEAEPAVAVNVREQYRFFVVDEYQDVSPLQQRLLELWLGDRRELCVVGDASQTIYSFAGARNAYLLDFQRRWPDAEVVRLEHNYRSTPQIVAAANALMRGRPGALALRSEQQPGPAPEVQDHPTDAAEAASVARSVAQEISAGADPAAIAILYRVNSQGAILQAALDEHSVPFQVRGAGRFFDQTEVRQALLAIRGASVAPSAEPLFQSVSDVLRSLGWSQQPPETRGALRERWESLNALMALVDEQPPGTTMRAFSDELHRRQSAQHDPVRSTVTLATLHSAKGLEWERVHIVGASDGLLPISYATTEAQVDEERRLLYVGMTRARTGLSITWSHSGPGRSSRRQASRFLEEFRSRIAGAPSASVS